MVKRILIIDSDTNESLLFEKMLRETNLELEIDCINEIIEGSEIIKKGSYDCVFLDYRIPSYPLIFDQTKQINLSTPIITFISEKDKQAGNILMQKGDTFFLTKEYLTSVVFETSIMNAIKVKRIQNEEAKAKNLLQETQRITQIGNWTYSFKTKTFSLSDEAISILKCYRLMSLSSFCRRIDSTDFILFKNTIRELNNKFSTQFTVCYSTWTATEQFLDIRIVSTNDGVSGTIQDITRFKNALLSNEMILLKSKATKISLIACASMLLIIEAILMSYVDSFAISLIVAALAITIMAIILKPLVRLMEQFLINKIYCYYKEKVIEVIVALKELRRFTLPTVLFFCLF